MKLIKDFFVILLFTILLTSCSWRGKKIKLVVEDEKTKTQIKTEVEQKEKDLANDETNNNVESDWIIYENREYGFSLEHPQDLFPEILQDGTIAFVLWGPTQAEDTEFYDGINLNFLSFPLDGRSLMDIVEENRNNLILAYGEGEVSQIDLLMIDGQEGYIFNDYMAQYIYIPQGNDKYLEIFNATADPGELGYKETVFEMIESVKILE